MLICLNISCVSAQTIEPKNLKYYKGKNCDIKNNKPYSGKISGWYNSKDRSSVKELSYLICWILECDVFGHVSKNDSVFISGELKRGIAQGEWKIYRQDSTLRINALYKNGKINNKVVLYDNNGKIEYIYKYKSGKIIEYTFYPLGFEKEKNVNSILDFSKLKKDNNGLFCNIENNIPYSGKVSGMLSAWDSNLNIANIDYFGNILYPKDVGEYYCFERLNKNIFVTGLLIAGREFQEWNYFLEGDVFSIKANFINGKLDDNAVFYEYNKINRIERYELGVLVEYTEFTIKHKGFKLKKYK